MQQYLAFSGTVVLLIPSGSPVGRLFEWNLVVVVRHFLDILLFGFLAYFLVLGRVWLSVPPHVSE